MRSVLMAIAALALMSCASTHMKQYMGKDIREVILDIGHGTLLLIKPPLTF